MGNGTKIALLAVLVFALAFILYYATQDAGGPADPADNAAAPVQPMPDDAALDGPSARDPALTRGQRPTGGSSQGSTASRSGSAETAGGSERTDAPRREYSLFRNGGLQLDLDASRDDNGGGAGPSGERTGERSGGNARGEQANGQNPTPNRSTGSPTDATPSDADSTAGREPGPTERTDALEDQLAALDALESDDGDASDGDDDATTGTDARSRRSGRSARRETDATDESASGRNATADRRVNESANDPSGATDTSAAADRADRFIEHEVRSGDNFWILADEYLGSGEYVDLIRRANPMVDPNRLRVGQTLYIPSRVPRQADAADASGRSTPAGATANLPAEADTVRVRENDSLWRIAAREYGDGAQWRRIYEANRSRMDNPDDLDVGQVLILPAGDTENEDK